MSKEELVKVDESESIEELLNKPTLKIAEFFTGFLKAEKNEWKGSAGRLVQALVKNNLLMQLGREINTYIKEGRIKEDYLETDLNRLTLVELLKCIDEDSPDENRFEAMKKIFFEGASIDADGTKQALSYELMKVCRKLSSIDLLILAVCHDSIDEGAKESTVHSREQWIGQVSQKLPFGYKEFVELREENLEKLHLISGRTYSDGSGIRNQTTWRLTPLGTKLCEFIGEVG
ncbi:MAG: hypothetical protein CO042_03245 [Parcubacteria group bacterium CG_4_9_14_0_2_um_filter_41_8]|nr:MAG: hypothetical protein COV79_05105 [Parcubacteria group bacterium CG11_big_fil_rev_8_21_14_0_20_41_14]PJC40538.1 MAG: hypothetical protein CO042_03245 [Parcubacteria group bacterium CG_4_9_14_0_2_um_filter_41_8]